MPENVIAIYKKCGQTPLECVNHLKMTHPEWKHTPLTYAGRLDPLAEGVLLILAGEECHKKDEYMALNKEYELTVLFGFSTDTYDVLGKNTQQSLHHVALNDIKNALPQFLGRFRQAYPAYSSRTVDSKPLFQWAREGKIGDIVIPSHDVFVERIDILETNAISGAHLEKEIVRMISKVQGDFRQQEILNEWSALLDEKKDTDFQTVTFSIACGSGVYVRSIASELGKALKVPALALKIIRTKVGEYTIANSVDLDSE